MASIPLGGRFYKSDSLPISAQECINMYSNKPRTDSPTKVSLFNTPGITSETTAGDDVVNRGGHAFQEEGYVVNGQTLYRIDENTDPYGNKSYTSVDVSGGVTIPGGLRVIMSDNGREGDQLCIVIPDENNKFNAYIYTKTTNTLAQISDNDFDGPVNDVSYVDGYFLFTKKNSQTFFISNLRDGFTYTSTDSGTAEADTDNLVRAYILNNEPLLFGTNTFETFQNIGGSGFPFLRVEGGIQGKGLRSRFALEEVNDVLLFLGSGPNESPAIWMTDGTRPQKISTTPIDNAISGYTDQVIKAAFSWNYSQDGAYFVGFTFPGKQTFVYDFNSQEWHTRESTSSGGEQTICRISSITAVYSKLLIGDVFSNNIGFLDRDVFSEYGDYIRRRFVTPQFDNEGDPFWIDSLELWGDQGIGLLQGIGEDPTILMSFSRDGGRSFSNPVGRSIGKRGEYEHRTIWNSLGRFEREVCFRFDMTEPVRWGFAKLEARFS